MIEVRQHIGLEHQRGGEHAGGIFEHGHAAQEERFQYPTLLHHAVSKQGMDIADDDIGLIALAIRGTDSLHTSLADNQLADLGTAQHPSALLLNGIDERLHQQTAVAAQSPAALYVAALSVSKGEQRQRLAAQLGLHGSTGQDIDHQRVVKERQQIVVGADIHHVGIVDVSGGGTLQQPDIAAQGLAVGREVSGHHLGKTVVALGKAVGVGTDGDTVETVSIEPLPRQA